MKLFRIYPYRKYSDYPVFTIDAETHDEALDKYLERYKINKKIVRVEVSFWKELLGVGKGSFDRSDFKVVEVDGIHEINNIAYYKIKSKKELK